MTPDNPYPAWEHFTDSPHTIWRLVSMRQWGRKRVRHVAYFGDFVAAIDEIEKLRREGGEVIEFRKYVLTKTEGEIHHTKETGG